MSQITLEHRVTSLESKLAEIQAQVGEKDHRSWIKMISGAFANDPIYDEAMRFGKEYRESLRPKPAKKRGVKKRNVHPRHGSHIANGKSK